MLFRWAAGERRSQQRLDPDRRAAAPSARLILFLALATIVYVAWVAWRYGPAAPAIDQLSDWLVDFLAVATGAGLITLILLWSLVVWQIRRASIVKRTSMTVEELYELSPRDFEHFVANLFASRGYYVTVRGRAGDLGVDLEVVRPDGRRAIVQCKRYRHSIGPDIVRELFGTMVHEMSHHGFLVTTAEITAAAREWAQGKPITLIDGFTLAKLATEAGVIH